MKAVIGALILMAIVAAAAALTGVEHISIIGANVKVVHHSAAGRAVAAVFCAICGLAAYGCATRRMYGWCMVAAMLGLFIVIETAWAIWELATLHLGAFGIILGLLGEGLKVAAAIWFLSAFWMPRKKEFAAGQPAAT